MGARSAAGAVDVGLGGARQLEVHHVVDRGEVEAARGDVGGEQGALGLRDETVDRLEARTLLHVALQRDDIDLQPGEQRAQPAGGGGRWREGQG